MGDGRYFRGWDIATGNVSDSVAMGFAALSLLLMVAVRVVGRGHDHARSRLPGRGPSA